MACAVPLVVVLVSACQQSPPPGDERPDDGGATVSVSPSGHGTVFLDADECASRGRNFREVSCTSEKAQARVVVRYEGAAGRRHAAANCPAETDFVLHISDTRRSGAGTGTGAPVVRGYACMRNLDAPHPGDPGGGGGPRTVVGDCVYRSAAGQVRETACDGSGKRKPEFKVASAVTERAKCPGTTALYVQLGGGRPVGCAVAV